jgi:hypothetical protein
MTTPIRIQLSRAKGWRMPPNTVKVDRTTVFGNPCTCQRPHGCSKSPEFEWQEWGDTPEQAAHLRCCVDVFRHYVETGLAGAPTTTGRFNFAMEASSGYPNRTKLIERLSELRGKNLACWCPLDAPCHADVLLELANQEPNR